MKRESTDYDVIVIGGGVAGLSAALYSCRAMLRTVVFEQGGCGGQILLTDVIENYPGFPEGITGVALSSRMDEQARKFGAEIRHERVIEIQNIAEPLKIVRMDEGEYRARALIIASGGSYNKLGVRGEEEYAGRGVSYCAVCDGNFFRDQDIVVIGGGDSAMQESLYLAPIVNHITVIHRRDELRASKILQERAFRNEKIDFLWSHVVEEILGDEKGVNAVRVHNLKTDEMYDYSTQGVFIFIGFHANNDFLPDEVPLDATGHVLTDIQMRTEIPGVFAAGDIRSGSNRQLASAAGDGVTAALSAYEYLIGASRTP